MSTDYPETPSYETHADSSAPELAAPVVLASVVASPSLADFVPIGAATMSRTELARARRLGPVVNAATRSVIESPVSPLASALVEFNVGDERYSLLFRWQNVKGYEEFSAGQTVQAVKMRKELGLKDDTDAKISDLLTTAPSEKVLQLLLFNQGVGFRDEKIALYVPCIEAWNVLDEDGQPAAHDVEAFHANGGIYDNALAAVESSFLRLSGRAKEETPKTATASSTDGATPSSTPAKEPATTDSATVPDGALS